MTAAEKARQAFLDNPGAKPKDIAKRFKLSLPYVYKIREKATGDVEVVQPSWREAMDAAADNPRDAMLGSRAKDYGVFRDNARLAQALKRTLADHAEDQGQTFADDQWEAIEMIATKLSRIVNGNPDKADSWDDIAGYAQLVSDRIRGNVR
jgi:hypothetical protein